MSYVPLLPASSFSEVRMVGTPISTLQVTRCAWHFESELLEVAIRHMNTWSKHSRYNETGGCETFLSKCGQRRSLSDSKHRLSRSYTVPDFIRNE